MEADVIKIAVVGIIGAVMAVVLKDRVPVFALMMSVITAVVIFLFVLPKLSEAIELFNNISTKINIRTEYISILIKSIAISYIAMFSSQLCRDFGQNSIAEKVELGGKLTIIGIAIPVVTGLMESVLNIF